MSTSSKNLSLFEFFDVKILKIKAASLKEKKKKGAQAEAYDKGKF